MAVVKPNALLGVQGMGVWPLFVEEIEHGIEITGTSDASRNDRTFYPRLVNAGTFSISIVFPSWDDYNNFSGWMIYYGRRLGQGGLSRMRVVCPVRRFDKLGVPNTDITFGDRQDIAAFRLKVGFIGADNYNNKMTSVVIPSEDTATQFFYPSGTQLNGQKSAPDDSLYGNPGLTGPLQWTPAPSVNRR